MRILQYMGMSSLKYGGLEKFLVCLIKASADFGLHYCLIYNEMPRSSEFVRDVENAGGEIRWLSEKGNQFRLFAHYLSSLRDYKPDVVHFHFGAEANFFAMATKMLPNFRKIKIFRTIHCCEYGRGKHIHSYSEFGLRTKAFFLFGTAYRFYDRIFCVSDFVREQWQSIFPKADNLETIYFGSPAVNSSSSPKNELKDRCNISGKNVLCSILFSSFIKGPDVLIRALPYVKSDYSLILIGLDDSPYTQELVALAKQLCVYDKILLVGISNDVSKYLEFTDLYIQPSRTEALSLSCMEAASYSIPVIGSDVGGLPEISNCVFPAENHVALAELIDGILSDQTVYKKYSLESYNNWHNKFKIENSIKNYIDKYNQI